MPRDHTLVILALSFFVISSQISYAKTTGSNDRYERFEWSFVNSTEFLTLTGPSPPRTFTLPPMTCFIVTFIPSALPAGMGFQLNYTYQDLTPAPTPPPNVVPTDEASAASSDKVKGLRKDFTLYFIYFQFLTRVILLQLFSGYSHRADCDSHCAVPRHRALVWILEMEKKQTQHEPSAIGLESASGICLTYLGFSSQICKATPFLLNYSCSVLC
jgi:hypothetical protein